jgi:hypothetical protein
MTCQNLSFVTAEKQMKRVDRFLQALATRAHSAQEKKTLSNSSARVALAIAGKAISTGDFPVAMTKAEIQGITGCHHGTIRNALDWLSNSGLVVIEEGQYRSGGSHEMIIKH